MKKMKGYAVNQTTVIACLGMIAFVVLGFGFGVTATKFAFVGVAVPVGGEMTR